MSAKVAFGYIPVAGIEEARALGKHLLEKQLVSCVNIFPQVESLYHWQGKLEEATEAILVAKTDESLKEALTKEILAKHSYTTPCVLFLDAEATVPAYFDWHQKALGK